MKPEIEKYVDYKKRILTEDFEVPLTIGDLVLLRRCTTISSVDVACRQILKRNWRKKNYIS